LKGRTHTRYLAAAILVFAGLIRCEAESAQAPLPTLSVGDPAPPIEAMVWLKGEPVRMVSPGQVYVVDFWATWCGPCAASMPHLTELQKKYAGRVRVIGVNVRESERGNASPEEVKAFVRKKQAVMDYTIAMDDPDRRTVFDAWMVAAGAYGIPTAFIADRNGLIVWVGYPSERKEDARFEIALEKAIAGTSDLPAARASQREANERDAERLKTYVATLRGG
jgi:thiol-disulfide isomerase/thioredoxin